MTSELTPILARAAVCVGLAIVTLLLARKPLRRWFGASLAYQSWLIVPAVTLVALLPPGAAPALIMPPALQPVQALSAHATPTVAAHADMLLIAWSSGALLAAAWFIFVHGAFLRQVGRLTRRGDVYLSDTGAGPASIGLLRPIIIVPLDFTQLYTPAEQALILSHERVHIERRDALVNLATALFQCAFWFHPLVHIGARCLRQDQELACDAIVMQRHPRQRRAYAEALLRSHTGLATPAGLHCHWQSHHPTKERIMSLQQTSPGTARRLAGRCLLALLVTLGVGATLTVRAEQAATASSFSVHMTVDPGDGSAAPHSVTWLADKFSVRTPEDWQLDMAVSAAQRPGEVWLSGKIIKGKETIGAPRLLTRIGEPATIKVGDGAHPFAVTMVVSRQP